jgi:predicted dehydrogenase
MARSGIHVAVVGMGFGAEFVPIYLDHPNVRAVTVCEKDPLRLQRSQQRHPKARFVTDFLSLLNDADVDAIHLLSGIPEHAPQAVATLHAGKHCACTVPMATSLYGLQEIIRAQQKSGKNYMMMETAVYTRQFLYALALKERGEFGRIQFLRGAHYQDMERWPLYWAGLPPMWYATHAVSPLLAFANTRAIKVHCFGSGVMREELVSKYGNPFPVETAIFQLETPQLSAEVTRTLFQTARPYMESFTIYGENACYEWQMEDQSPMLFRMSPVKPNQIRDVTITQLDRNE